MAAAVELSARELELVLHALGEPKHRRVEPYRNRYLCDAADRDGQIWAGLVLRGLARVYAEPEPGLGFPYTGFTATPEGVRAALATRPDWRCFVVEVDGNVDRIWAPTHGRARAEMVSRLLDATWVDSFAEGLRAVRSVRLA